MIDISALIVLERAAVLGCILLLQSCSTGVAPVTQTRNLPYALSTLTLNDHTDEATFAACFQRIEEILGKFNMYAPDSEISEVNRSAGINPVQVSDDFRAVLRQGLELARLTGGLFDPTVGPLVNLWGIGSDSARVPPLEDIRSAMQLVGWKDVVLDEAAGTVFLKRARMTLDFGALLKGFAAVEAGRVLSSRGVKSAILDIGGSVLTIGSRRGGGPWRIGLQKPDAPLGVSFGEIQARDEVINTSGTYERFFTLRGKRYHHILDPRTGYPVKSNVEAATVISNRLRNADGPTLSILALGVDDGLSLAQRLGVDAVIVATDHSLHLTPGASRRFTLRDPAFTITPP